MSETTQGSHVEVTSPPSAEEMQRAIGVAHEFMAREEIAEGIRALFVLLGPERASRWVARVFVPPGELSRRVTQVRHACTVTCDEVVRRDAERKEPARC